MITNQLPKRAADFLCTEANGWRSRETVTLDAGTDGLKPGTVLGRVTASGGFAALNPGASDGSQTVAGVLLTAAQPGVSEKVAIVRDAEVFDLLLVFPDGATVPQLTAARAGLNAIGIAIRTET